MLGTNIIPPIKDFSDDGRYWRIDWLGRLTWNPKILDAPLTEPPKTGPPKKLV